jgi:ECF sigma factor
MPEESSGQVTQLLKHWVRGDEKALHDLIPVVSQESRRLARSHLQSQCANSRAALR